MKFGLQPLVIGLTWFTLSLAIKLPGYSTDLQIKLNEITSGKNYPPPKEGAEDSAWPQRVVYTTALKYKDGVEQLTNNQLAGLTMQAWDEMAEYHKDWIGRCKTHQKDMKKIRPGMMTAIAFGDTVYLGSSIKQNGKHFILSHKDAVMTRAVVGCRIQWLQEQGITDPPKNDEDPTASHRSSASCGEIMTSSLVLKATDKLPMSHVTGSQRVRVVSYGSGKAYNGEPKLWAPCSASLYDPGKGDSRNNNPFNAMGCMQFSEWQKLTILDPDKDASLKPEKVSMEPSEIIDISLEDVWTIETEESIDPVGNAG